MHRFLLAMMLSGATAALHAEEAPPTSPRERAEAAATDLATTLKTALQTRMQADGPLGAIDFCQQQAPVLTAEVAARHGVALGRSASKLRNPANAPTPWQQHWLTSMATAVAAGQEVASQQREVIVNAADTREYRYARALRTEAPCLICHGSAVAEPIRAAIAERYPQDQATGFAEGELRGLLWVSFELPNAD
jgi:hypothetical protein